MHTIYSVFSRISPCPRTHDLIVTSTERRLNTACYTWTTQSILVYVGIVHDVFRIRDRLSPAAIFDNWNSRSMIHHCNLTAAKTQTQPNLHGNTLTLLVLPLAPLLLHYYHLKLVLDSPLQYLQGRILFYREKAWTS